MLSKLGYEALTASQASMGLVNEIIENLSNVYSIGYKKSKTTFAEALNGEVSKHQNKIHSQGVLRKTAELYDLGIEGPGYFEVELPNGQRAYTRAGRLGLTSDAELVTKEGYKLIPEVEGISETTSPSVQIDNAKSTGLGINIEVTTPKFIIPPDVTPEIAEDGTINAINPESGEKTKIGKIKVVVFNNPQGLESIGSSYYLETNESGKPLDIEASPNTATKIKQGYVEYSNVDIAASFMEIIQLRNVISAQLKTMKVLDKLYENIHYTVSRAA